MCKVTVKRQLECILNGLPWRGCARFEMLVDGLCSRYLLTYLLTKRTAMDVCYAHYWVHTEEEHAAGVDRMSTSIQSCLFSSGADVSQGFARTLVCITNREALQNLNYCPRPRMECERRLAVPSVCLSVCRVGSIILSTPDCAMEI